MIRSAFLRRGLAAACSLLLALSVAGCGASKDDSAQKIALLEQENTRLKAQVAELQQQLASRDTGILESWTLDVTGTDPDTPAAVYFTAVPAAPASGQSAVLLAELDGQEAGQAVCDWDGTRYSAFLSLNPADGYSYRFVLTDSSGASEQLLLSSPEDPVKPLATYLASGLQSYGDVAIDGAEFSSDTLTLDYLSAVIQPQMITPDGTAILVQSAQLHWLHNGQLLKQLPVQLSEGEAAGYWTATVSGLVLPLPALQEGDQLELQLCAALSDGSELIADGAGWICHNGQPEMIVG